MRVRIALLILAAGALAPAGTGAAASTPTSATKTVLAALQRTCAKRSERLAFTGKARMASGDSFTFSGNGVVGSSPPLVRLVYRYRMSSGARWTMELRADSHAAYMRMPGKSWVRFTRAQFRQQLGTAWTDLQTQLRSLQTGTSARRIGVQLVRERRLTHYTLRGSAAGRPVGVWIDRTGLVRRVTVALDLGGSRFETTVDYVAFGVPVDVSMPPQSRVVDFAPPDAETARRNVNNATVAIESWYAEHGTYAGATASKLRIASAKIVSASRTSYCIQSTVGRTTMHKAGPAAPVVAGRCRR